MSFNAETGIWIAQQLPLSFFPLTSCDRNKRMVNKHASEGLDSQQLGGPSYQVETRGLRTDSKGAANSMECMVRMTQGGYATTVFVTVLIIVRLITACSFPVCLHPQR